MVEVLEEKLEEGRLASFPLPAQFLEEKESC